MVNNTLNCILASALIIALGQPAIADENALKSTQEASGSNSLEVDQSGGEQNTATIYQKTTGGNNQVNVMQVQQNSLTVEQQTFGSSDSHNTLIISQNYQDSIDLSQTSQYGNNYANISQGNALIGNNVVKLNQYSNGLTLDGFGNVNRVEIVQDGYNNKLVGAKPGENGNSKANDNFNQTAYDNASENAIKNANENSALFKGVVYTAEDIIDLSASAYQYSESSYNVLELYQVGDSNIVGLHQYGAGSNTADIIQTGNNNKVGVYQTNSGTIGANQLTVNQNGSGLNVGVSMEVSSGINNIEITQNNAFFNGNALP